MLTRHAHNRRTRNRLLRGRGPRRGGGALTLRQQIGQVLGVEPQVFADARDLTVGDGNAVATWGDLTGHAESGSLPVLDADFWGGSLPAVDMRAAGAVVQADAEAANYDTNLPRVWVLSCQFDVIDSGDRVIALASSTSAQPRGEFVGDTVQFFERDDAGGSDLDTGSGLPTDELCHVGLVTDGATASAIALTASGEETLLNNAPRDTLGAATYDRLTIGAARRAAFSSQTEMRLALVTLVRCSAGAATQANLQAILNLHNQAYPVA